MELVKKDALTVESLSLRVMCLLGYNLMEKNIVTQAINNLNSF